MLRKIRTVLAALFFAAITVLLTGHCTGWLGWTAKLQFLPSCLAFNLAAVCGIVLFTILFGRLYCSVICPFGVLQDIVIRLRKKIFPKHKSHWRKEKKWLRYPVLVILSLAIVCDIQVIAALIGPYSQYGRIVRMFLGGPWQLYAVGGLSLAVALCCAWFWGREYCNAVCPVGTLLGLLGGISLFRMEIDEDKCVKCGKCAKDCKASCIDSANGRIDYTRCLDCFDCIGSCKSGAISYRLRKTASHKDAGTDPGRRAFLGGAALFLGGVVGEAAQKNVATKDFATRTAPDRSGRIVPRGAGSVKLFYNKCTACQLCVSSCPNGVLHPSTDLQHLMQPVMDFEKGYCRPECTACSEVCPSGAIVPVRREEKALMAIGIAKVDPDLCVMKTDGVSCGNCARHCPTGAVRIKGKRPVVMEELCIGCGACEYLCPARPVSAIHIDGLSTHISRQ